MTLGATENVVSGKEDLLSPWALKQDPSQRHSLHTEILELHDHRQDYSTEEQMVPGPASMSYQPYRYCTTTRNTHSHVVNYTLTSIVLKKPKADTPHSFRESL